MMRNVDFMSVLSAAGGRRAAPAVQYGLATRGRRNRRPGEFCSRSGSPALPNDNKLMIFVSKFSRATNETWPRSIACASLIERPARPATVRAGPLGRIPEVLRDFRCRPAHLLSESGFAVAFFDDPDLPIPYVAASRLIERCVEATRCEHFGLPVGERTSASSLALAGLLLLNAAEAGSALRDLLRYLELYDSGGVVSLETRDATSILGDSVVEPGSHAADPTCDLSMAVACKLMRAFCGDEWTPREVLLPRRPPADQSP